MKQLLSGIAVAALVAAGTPALAQTMDNASPQTTTPPGASDDSSQQTTMPQGTGAESGATTPSTGQEHAKKHAAHRNHKSSSQARAGGNNIAEQLNREELQRVTSNSGSSTNTGAGTSAPSNTMPGGSNTMPSGTVEPAPVNPGATGSPAGNAPSPEQMPGDGTTPSGSPPGAETR